MPKVSARQQNERKRLAESEKAARTLQRLIDANVCNSETFEALRLAVSLLSARADDARASLLGDE